MKQLMKRALALALILSVMLSLTGCVTGTIYGRSLKPLEGSAVSQGALSLGQVMKSLQEEDKEALSSLFSGAEGKESAAKAYDTYLSLKEEYGRPVNGWVSEAYEFGGFYVFVYTMTMENGKDLLLQGEMNEALELSSLYLYESLENFDAKQTLPEGVKEIETTLGEGTEHPLPCKITYPDTAENSDTKIPGVVLVAGDGANTMDMTAGSTKLYRDLAWYLASQGIAVIRYDKRTLVYQIEASMENAPRETQTTAFEYTEDANLAFHMLEEMGFVDASRIFFLGHSQGALMAPRADEANPYGEYKGFILLNTSPRPWSEVIYDQYINYGLIDRKDEEIYYLVSKLKTDKKFIEDGSIIKVSETEALEDFPLGRSAAFWQDYLSYDYVEGLKKLQKPTLILQGENDYQITLETDFAAWQETMQGEKYVTFRSFPNLNHLMVLSKGAFAGHYKEYDIPGLADEAFLQTVSDWIKAQ